MSSPEVRSSRGPGYRLGPWESSFSPSLPLPFCGVLLDKSVNFFVPWCVHVEQCFSAGGSFALQRTPGDLGDVFSCHKRDRGSDATHI